jgi:hypothetical protein
MSFHELIEVGVFLDAFAELIAVVVSIVQS